MKYKKNIILITIIFVIFAGGFYYFKNYYDGSEKHVYEVLVQVRDQNVNGDEKEDAKTSLKKGDVLLTQGEGHNWSATEKVSYLILKMNLTERQKEKLVDSVYKKLTRKEIKEEIENFKKDRDDIPDEEIDRYKEELKNRKDVVILRKYRINMEKYFPDFVANDLVAGQPYEDKVFNWSIVQKK